MQEERGSPSVDGESVRRFLASRFLFDPDAEIDPRASLLGEGILDSTGAMELVLFIEEEFGVAINDDELTPANLDSIERVVTLVAQKRSSSREIVSRVCEQTAQVESRTTIPKPEDSRATYR